jgi:hypothetical protein
MSLSQISNGTKVLLGAGILLLLDSFFDWNKACVAGHCATGSSGWDGIGVLFGILLLATLAVVIFLLLVEMDVLKVKVPEIPIKWSQLIAGLGGLTVLFGIIGWIQKPSGGGVVDVGWSFWGWAGLVLIIVFAVGVVLRFQEGDKEGMTSAAPSA